MILSSAKSEKKGQGVGAETSQMYPTQIPDFFLHLERERCLRLGVRLEVIVTSDRKLGEISPGRIRDVSNLTYLYYG